MSILLPKWRHSMSCRRRSCRRLEEISCQQGCPKRQDMSATSCRQYRDFFELKHLDWFELVAVIDINYSSPGSPYSSGAYYSWSLAALIVLSPVSCLSPVCQSVVTCLQVDLMRMRAINGQTLTVCPPKIFSRSFAKNLFLKKTRKEKWALTSPTEGGPGGHPPPAFTRRTTGNSRSPSKAFSFFWSLLLTPGSPYSFGGILPKTWQPLMLFCLLSVRCSRAYKWNFWGCGPGNGQTLMVQQRGGSREAFPPAFTRTNITSKSLGEAVFIVLSPVCSGSHMLTSGTHEAMSHTMARL